MSFSKTDQGRLDSIKSNISTAVSNEIDRIFGTNARTNAASTQDQENQLLTAFRALDQAGRDKVLSYAQGLVTEQTNKAKGESDYLNFHNQMIMAATDGSAVKFQ